MHVSPYLNQQFQSRNRESYFFKIDKRQALCRATVQRFNLVIENLIFSSSLGYLVGVGGMVSFNLVIENLIFSSLLKVNASDGTLAWFQSRNRESYFFKKHLWFSEKELTT